jgi:hypothetical protein
VDKPTELRLFASLSNSRFREWVSAALDKAHHELVNQREIQAISRAQGRAQLLLEMLELVDKAPGVIASSSHTR